MRLSTLVGLVIICTFTSLLSACASGPSGSAPALGAQAPQTSRVPSPGNIRATELNQSARMTLPAGQ